MIGFEGSSFCHAIILSFAQFVMGLNSALKTAKTRENEMTLITTVRALLIITGFFVGATGAEAPKAARKPNLIVMLADDLGYETIGANGGTSYRTPALDKLAATGTRFTHCYAQPLCT